MILNATVPNVNGCFLSFNKLMKNILIIDDNPFDLNTMARVLQDAGYQPLTAETGIGAVDLIRSQSIDLVITDMVMPEQDGLQTIMKIRDEFADLPIIAMSGAKTVAKHNEEDSVMAVSGTQILHRFPKDYHQQLEQLKLSCFIQKPCNAVNLIKILQEVFHS